MKISKSIFRNLFLAGVSACLLRLSYPKFNLWLFAWFALVPLFLALEGKRRSKAFLISLFCGVLFYVLTIFWLINVTVPGMVILSCYLGSYVAFFGLAYGYAKEKTGFWQRLFFLPSLWVALELLRAYFFTGFPWALMAHSQTSNLLAIQAADIFGAYGVSFIVIFVNVALFENIRAYRMNERFNMYRILIPFLILLVWLAYGSLRIKEDPKRSCPFKVTVIQGNIAQEIKWVQSLQETIFKKYKLLTEIAHLKEASDLIIWPETSYPEYLEFGENDKPLKKLAEEARAPLLVGSITLKDMDYFNSAILYSASGEVSGVYDKIHLVPYGEFIPCRKFCPFMQYLVPIEDFTPGEKYSIFSVSGVACPSINFGVLICFEDIFGSLASRFVRRGADFLVNITNDAWFGDTSSPYQHMQASVFRAIENRVYVVRAANTGISCIIDDAGRPLASVRDHNGKEAFVTGYISGFIYKTARSSLYAKIGDVFAFACALYALAGMLYLSFRRKIGSNN